MGGGVRMKFIPLKYSHKYDVTRGIFVSQMKALNEFSQTRDLCSFFLDQKISGCLFCTKNMELFSRKNI